MLFTKNKFKLVCMMSKNFSRFFSRVLATVSGRLSNNPSGIVTTAPRRAKIPSDPFYPKIFSIFRNGYYFDDFIADIIAGITVGIVAMPLAMAFAIASGVNPIQGLYTAVIAGILIGFLGGSRFQVSGPTGAFVIIIYGIVYRHGYDGLVITTLMAGMMLCLAGFFRLGSIIKYIPYPVTTGFTAGIALTIFSSQLADFFGMSLTNIPPEFLLKWELYLQELSNFSPITLTVGMFALGSMVLVKIFIPKVPSPVIGVIMGTILVWLFGLPVETVASRFGEIPTELPSFSWPEITLLKIEELLPDAITIAILAGLESLLTCVVADSMTGDKHYSNIELVAQGSGNIACSLFGGIPATGAIARTATNISSGARSPVSALVHGVTVLVFILWLSPVTSAIPLACLAAVMVMTSYTMLEIQAIKTIFKGPASDWGVMLITFFLTVLIDLTVAVYTGVLLASLLFMRSMSEASSIQTVEHESMENKTSNTLLKEYDLHDAVQLFCISGPFFFGMVDRFQHIVNRRNKTVKVYILQMRDVVSIDATATHVLENFLSQRKTRQFQVIIAEAPPATRRILRHTGIIKELGEDNMCHSLQIAVERANALASQMLETNEKSK